MRCIHCQTDNDYQSRVAKSQHCHQCGHALAFEPKTQSPRMSDPQFQKIIETASLDHQLFFTERQLWHMVNRWLNRHSLLGCIGKSSFFIVFILCMFYSMVAQKLNVLERISRFEVVNLLIIAGFTVVLPILFGLIIYLLFFSGKNHRPELSFETFRQEYLDRWIAVHGQPEKLLLNPTQRPATRLTKEPDLTAYSFDRVLVTDSDEIAAILIANQFHVDSKCAVVSQNGYPNDIFDDLLQMLRRNPKLQVFALHDASLSGFKLLPTLRRRKWFPGTYITLVDLGLRPNTVKQLKLFTLPGESGSLAKDVRQQLKAPEIKWLERGYMAEVANIPPGLLMPALNRGMAQATEELSQNQQTSFTVLATGAAATAGSLALLAASDPFEAESIAQRQRDGSHFISSDFG